MLNKFKCIWKYFIEVIFKKYSRLCRRNEKTNDEINVGKRNYNKVLALIKYYMCNGVRGSLCTTYPVSYTNQELWGTGGSLVNKWPPPCHKRSLKHALSMGTTNSRASPSKTLDQRHKGTVAGQHGISWLCCYQLHHL